MKTAEFEVDVGKQDALRFAELSGDWNPLHTDPDYAKKTEYRDPILHGAFSAGLLSRMAGMFLPGRECLLYGIKLKFVAPVIPPARLRVSGLVLRDNGCDGLVEVTISDAENGTHYVAGSYEFGRHQHEVLPQANSLEKLAAADAVTLVTGASGGVGGALLARLGSRGLGFSRSDMAGTLGASSLDNLPELLAGRKIAGIVHCGWPSPDNQRLTALGRSTDAAVHHHVAEPLSDCIKLAKALADHGLPGAILVLVGSTAASPGRHNWRMPLYSLAKSLVPTLVGILATELGAKQLRCVGLVLDVIDGGMNAGMRDAVKLAHSDRSPSGVLPGPSDVAGEIDWVLSNSSMLVSGAVLNLSGGAAP